MFSKVYNQTIKCKEDYISKHSTDVYWEPYIVSSVCKYLLDGTDFLDIGAHIGLISLAVNIEKPGHTIHCIECNNLNFEHLYYNMGGHPNINLYNFAVGDKYKMCNMIVNEENSGCTHINSVTDSSGSREVYDYKYLENVRHHYSKNTIFYSVIPLDSIPFSNRISVVKIDVEGFEYFLLLGAKQFLKKHQPVLVIEIDGEKVEHTNDLLNELGYTLID